MNPLPADTGSAQGPGNKCSCSEMSLRLQGWPLRAPCIWRLSLQFPLCAVSHQSDTDTVPRTGVPFPSHPRVACSALPAFAVVLVPPSSCGSRLETKLRPGEPAGPAMGSASPRLRPPLLALAHAQGSLPVAISPGLLLPPFSFGPLKK